MSAATISMMLAAGIVCFCNSNVWAELSIVSMISSGVDDKVRLSELTLLSKRWATVRAMSPFGEIVSKTPW